MKKIKKIYDEHFGALLCGMIAASVLCIFIAFFVRSECFFDAGLLLISGAIVLPFIVEPQI